MENLHYLQGNINWNLFVQHPIELIRIDTLIKLKQIDIEELVNYSQEKTIHGWTKQAGIQAFKHLRLLYSMRCFLQIMAKDYFYFYFPDSHITELKKSFDENSYQEYIESCEIKEFNVSSLANNSLYIYLQVLSDFENTKSIFRQMLQKLFLRLNQPNNRDLVESLIGNLQFSV